MADEAPIPNAPSGNAAAQPSGQGIATLFGGVLLLLPALADRWPAAVAALAVVVSLPFRPFVGRGFWAVVMCAAFAGGATGAALVGTELTPPGSTLANLANLALRTAWVGALEAVWIGGSAALLLSAYDALRPRRRKRPPAAAPKAPWARALVLLRPLRLAVLLAVVALSPSLRPGREVRTLRAALKTDLLSLGYYQGRRFETTGSYATDASQLGELRPSPGVRLTITLVDSTHWRARAVHPRLTTFCAIASGAREGVAGETSDPVCRERQRWF